jgi:hypothetical protein
VLPQSRLGNRIEQFLSDYTLLSTNLFVMDTLPRVWVLVSQNYTIDNRPVSGEVTIEPKSHQFGSEFRVDAYTEEIDARRAESFAYAHGWTSCILLHVPVFNHYVQPLTPANK